MSGFEELPKEDKQVEDLQNSQLTDDGKSNEEVSKDVAPLDEKKARENFDRRRRYILGIASSGVFIALMIISAFISIPIGPIKITLQFMITNICCLLLGRKWGAISVFLYLLLGLLGLPIFSNGGGFGYVLQPSFGFLIGFAIGGFFAAWFRDKVGKSNFLTYFFASLIDMAIMDVIGVAYGAGIMYGYMHSTMGVWKFLMAMLIPFIPIDIIKCVICSLICPKLNKFSLARR